MPDRDSAALADKSLPRWWKVAAWLFAVRCRNALTELVNGHPGAARAALSPSIVCTCWGWTPCHAYYLKGWYTYCPTCGVYQQC